MAEINQRVGMATISLGSGPSANVMFLFSSDICGESPRKPRHARAYADLAALHEQIDAERIRALTAFRADVASGAFPSESEVGQIDPDELKRFVESID
jgi:3-methyl-2-oxobutanoate hydroxymethyltransferase